MSTLDIDIVELLTTQPACRCAASGAADCACNTTWPSDYTDRAAAEITRLRVREADLKAALRTCVDALYNAIAIAPLDRLPPKAGSAIQEAETVYGVD